MTRLRPPLALDTSLTLSQSLDILLHPYANNGLAPWRALPWLLALGFFLRAAIALAGDFMWHPDEIMQYLEPAHQWVFGYGVSHWEQFYGGRSWLIPGLVSLVLWPLKWAGLGEPTWYVPAVKLLFCALSMSVPAAMYWFARRHFGEMSARCAFVGGLIWYELAGFAHKPMSECLATGALLWLLVLSIHPALARHRALLGAAALFVLTLALRMQYAPIALIVMGIVVLRAGRKWYVPVGYAVLLSLCVGVLDGLPWGWEQGLFHTYVTNALYNLYIAPLFSYTFPVWQYFGWIGVASGGLFALLLPYALLDMRRYQLLVFLVLMLIMLHGLQSHKEYRFVFAAIPMWLMIGGDVVCRLLQKAKKRAPAGPLSARLCGAVLGALFVSVSLAGLLNALPIQDRAYVNNPYKDWRQVRFVRGQDAAMKAYEYLSEAPDVYGIWHIVDGYYVSPGYYYLHRAVPLYAGYTYRLLNCYGIPLNHAVSHIVAHRKGVHFNGFSLHKTIGDVYILKRDDNTLPVLEWESYTPVIVEAFQYRFMLRQSPDARRPPDDFGIRYRAPVSPQRPARSGGLYGGAADGSACFRVDPHYGAR